MKKILLLVRSAVILFSFGFSASLHAGDHVMVKCEGVKEEVGGCSKAGCSIKPSTSKFTTLEECERAGGRPVEVEKMD